MNNFWKDKKVLVTGHTGFKGGWLSLWLYLLGAKVYGISLKPNKKSFYNFTKLEKIIYRSNFIDITNFELTKKKIIEMNPQIVFHLAAQPLVLESYKLPLKTLKTNIVGTANVLESLKKCKNIKSIIVVTTDKIYGSSNKKFIETDRLAGNDIYSASKSSVELISAAFYTSFFKKKNILLSTVRAGNVIGGGDFSKNRIVPDIINSIKNNKRLIIRNPFHTRPWQNIFDPLYGYLILAEKLFKGNKNFVGPWNFGPDEKNCKVKSLVKKFLKKKKFKYKEIKIKNSINETKLLNLNNNKSKLKLKWKPIINLNKSVDMILNWNFFNKKKTDYYKNSVDQIIHYIKLVKK